MNESDRSVSMGDFNLGPFNHIEKEKTNMTPTPRTDAAERQAGYLLPETWVVETPIARQLERELTGANTALKLMTEANAKLERELNEANRQLNNTPFTQIKEQQIKIYELERELAEAHKKRNSIGDEWKVMQDRDSWRKCAESGARVLSMYDRSQTSITISEWEEMKTRHVQHFNDLSKQP